MNLRYDNLILQLYIHYNNDII